LYKGNAWLYSKAFPFFVFKAIADITGLTQLVVIGVTSTKNLIATYSFRRKVGIVVACILAFRLSASHFLVLVPQKVTKEDDTQPSRPKGSLALLNKIRQSRNSTWQLTQNVSCCGIRTVAPSTLILSPLLSVMEWDLSRQTYIVEI